MTRLSRLLAAVLLVASLVGAQEGSYLEALVLLGEAASSKAEVEDAIARLEKSRPQFEGFARYHLALAQLYFKRGDEQAAASAIRKAIEVEPRLASSYVALGRLLEREDRLAEAEQAYEKAAGLSAEVSSARLVLADFYLRNARSEDARKILESMTEDDPSALPAWRRLGEIALEQRDFDSAEKAAATILNRLPGDLSASLLLGNIRSRQGRHAEAIALLEDLSSRYGGESEVQFELGRAYLAAGDSKRAVASLERAAELSPGAPGPHIGLAEAYLHTGELALAVGALDPALGMPLARRESLRLLGTVLLAGEDGERALDAWEDYEAAAPTDPLGPFSAARAHLLLKNPRGAEDDLDDALTVDPAYLPALTELVRLAFERNQPEVALARAQKQLELVPDSAPHHRLVGEVQRQLGQTDAAERSFRRAIELDPSSLESYVSLGSLLLQAGRSAESQALLSDARSRFGDDPRLLLLLAGASRAEGQIEEAKACYQRILELDPNNVAAKNNLAYIFLEEGNPQQAMKLALAARSLAPDDPDVADTVAWIYYAQGSYLAARMLLTEAASKRPQSAEIQYHLGMTLYRLDEKTDARRYLERALSLAPRAEFADEARRTLAVLTGRTDP